MKTHLLTKWLPAVKPLAVALALCGATAANATIIAFDTATPDSIPGVSTFVTSGDNMVGMTVRAIFGNGLDDTRNWAFISLGAGGVSGTDWSLTETGNTSSSPWTFTNNTQSSLLKLILDGAPGLTLFDTDFSDQEGTTGSSFGRTFEGTPNDVGGTATYSRPIKIGAAASVGDLFHVLTVDLVERDDQGVVTRNGLAGNWSFIQDTDNVAGRSVPEPATLALTMLGLAGLGLVRRRKFQG